jgi:hypothetical protein
MACDQERTVNRIDSETVDVDRPRFWFCCGLVSGTAGQNRRENDGDYASRAPPWLKFLA